MDASGEQVTSEIHARAAEDGDFLVVGVGASAGGLSALRRLLGEFDSHPGIAIIVVQHLSPTHASQLAGLLQSKCHMQVETALDGALIEPNCVYVIAPGTELTVEGGRLAVVERDSIQPDVGRLPVDLLFRSLADQFAHRAAGVVLSGTGTDGTLGVTALSEVGALTVAQTPGEAEYDGMPRSAIQTGRVDFVLDADAMAEKLLEHAQDLEGPNRSPKRSEDAANAEAYEEILDFLEDAVGHDFAEYKSTTVLRRIDRRMQVNACDSLSEYLSVLKSRESEPVALFRDLLISVTQFFRDPEAFEQLRTDVIPALLDAKGDRDELRIWVAGAATGEEAYSVAIQAVEAIEECDKEIRLQIFATDIDARAIKRARLGRYPTNIAADISPERLKRFFLLKNGEYIVHPALREVILFSEHDLLQDPPFSRVDLVLCRNLLIYLNRSAHPRLIRLFHFALRTSGYLFTGVSESAKGVDHLFRTVEGLDSIFQATPGQQTRRRLAQIPLNRPETGEMIRSIRERSKHEVSIESVHQLALLSQYAPPSVVINKHREFVHLNGGAGRLIQMADGTPTHSITDVSPRALALGLRTILHHLKSQDDDVAEHRVRYEQDGSHLEYLLRARWLPYTDEGDRLVQVTFEQATESSVLDEVDVDVGGKVAQVIEDLESELGYVREQLQVTVEEYETALEELRASNEELQSVNEELHSTTEELETSREELRSVNEELSTVNEQLRAKIQELNENQTYLENLLRATQIGTVFLDRDKQITHFTPSVGALLNVSPIDVGRPLLELSHRLDYEDFESDIERVLEVEEMVEREIRSDDGRWYIARLLPFYSVDETFTGVVISFIDITRRKTAELQLSDSEARYRSLFEGANDGIYVYRIDEDGRPETFLDVNNVIQSRLGFDGSQLAEMTVEDIVEPGSDDLEQATKTLLEVGEYMGERRELTSDGEAIDVEVNCRMLKMDRKPHVLTVSRDFTARKQYEQHLIAARLAAERLAKMQASFVANISHEVRTPLTSVIGLAQMLVKRLDPDSKDAQMASIIDRSANRLMQTLDSVLTLARIEAGDAALELDQFDIIEEVRQILATMEPQATERGLELELVAPSAGLEIISNREALSRILYNLVANAIKFTPEGVVTVLVEDAGARFRLGVDDTGIGIEDDFVAHAHEQFRQESTGDAREYSGIGLGLTIVSRIVELLSGNLEISSVKDRGTTVTVEFPKSPDIASRRSQEPSSLDPPSPDTSKATS